MLFFIVSFLSFLLLVLKPPLPLPSWVSEMRLLSVLICQELLCRLIQWIKSYWVVSSEILKMSSRMMARNSTPRIEINAVEAEEMTLLDLPELAIDMILERLSPAGLLSMAMVCTSLKDRCRSDHLWERHFGEKWGRVVGPAARRVWEAYLASANRRNARPARCRSWLAETVSCVWPCSWFVSWTASDDGEAKAQVPADDSVMAWYLALDSGRVRFPAQVYNRENGHVGFIMSCYDAELSYDSHTDTFLARYPPHGQRATQPEEGVKWDRLRAPLLDAPAHDLHVSDCLHDLRPGDHIEIQWRRNKEFPYGWWYGVVGHLESCDGEERHCRCFSSDTVMLEFNQYSTGSRWRTTAIDRKDHREKGNESDGFYGGIRKLHDKNEISTWRRLWPAEVLE